MTTPKHLRTLLLGAADVRRGGPRLLRLLHHHGRARTSPAVTPPARSTSRPASTTSTTPSSPAATTARSPCTDCRRDACSSSSASSRRIPETGWGYNEETKPMLQTTFGFVPWDDSHHPELSQTDGVPDGRWLFINAQQHAARRAHRPDALRDDGDPPDPELRRRPRIAVHDAGHQVHRLGHAVQRADAQRRRRRSTATSRTSRARCRSSAPTSRARWTSRSRS